MGRVDSSPLHWAGRDLTNSSRRPCWCHVASIGLLQGVLKQDRSYPMLATQGIKQDIAAAPLCL
jgi:hypothetical protein